MASETKASTTRRKTPTQTAAATKTPAKVAKVASKASKAPTKTAAVKAKTPATAKPAKPAEKIRAPRKAKAAMPMTAEARLRHIEVAAYYIAEQRGFGAGDTASDWLLAEQQVDHLLLAGKLQS